MSSSSNLSTAISTNGANIASILQQEYNDVTFDSSDAEKTAELRSMEAEYNSRYLIPHSILPIGEI